MSMDEERDLDLERRLRRIAEDPQPPVPLSVYRHSVAVTEERDGNMTSRGALVRFSRRGITGLTAVAGIAAAIVITFGAVSFVSGFRQAQAGTQPPASSPMGSPAGTTTPTSPAATGPWSAISFGRLASSPFSAAPQFVSAATVNGRTIVAGTVVVGAATTTVAAMSTDETTWTSIQSANAGPFPGAQQLRVAPCRNGFLMVGVAGQTTGYYSTDGVTWTNSVIGSPWPLPAQQNEIGTTSAGAIVVTGSGLYFSADCTTWRKVTLPAVGGAEVIPLVGSALHDTFVVGGKVAGSSDGLTFTSRDGSTWTKAPAASPSLVELWRARDGLLGSEEGNGGSGFHVTRDGQGWQQLSEPALLPSYGSLASDGTRIVLWKEQQRMLVTTDAVAWTYVPLTGAVPVTAAGDGAIQQIAVLPDGLLIFNGADAYLGRAQQGGPAATPAPTGTPAPTATPTAPAGAIWPAPTGALPADIVTDGADPTAAWTGLDLSKVKDVDLVLLTADPLKWRGGWALVSRANGSSPLVLWLSQDARTWHAAWAPGPFVFPSAAGLTVLDDQTKTAWSSADGIEWRQLPLSGLPAEWLFGMSTGSPSGIVLVMSEAAEPNLNSTYFSADGATWKNTTPDVAGGLVNTEVVWSGSRFVLTGLQKGSTGIRDEAAIFTSEDGQTWTRATGDTIKADRVGLAVGRDGMLLQISYGGAGARTWSWYTSADGSSWRKENGFGLLANNPTSPNAPNGILASNGVRIIGISYDGLLESSFDGRTWVKLGQLSFKPGLSQISTMASPPASGAETVTFALGLRQIYVMSFGPNAMWTIAAGR